MPEIAHVKIAVFLSRCKSGPNATIYTLAGNSEQLGGYHVVLVFRKNWWERTDGYQRAYVLRHELEHIGWLIDRAVIVDHDIDLGIFYNDLFYLDQAPRGTRAAIYYMLKALADAYETDSLREIMRRISPHRRRKNVSN